MAITKAAPQGTDDREDRRTSGERAGDGDEGRHLNSPLLLTMLMLVLVLLQSPIRRALAAPVMQSWTTVFVAVMVQALPFLVLGVLLSAAIAVFVPPSFFARALPRHPALAVPVAGA
ncbi:permease, partial [Streptomyces sp. T21Q-yed]|nr:permease [Streptomyces sp. T21Q-yed]